MTGFTKYLNCIASKANWSLKYCENFMSLKLSQYVRNRCSQVFGRIPDLKKLENSQENAYNKSYFKNLGCQISVK